MNKIELVDIYDENKNKTGKTKYRFNINLAHNEYTIGVQAIIINSNKQILISQRSHLKEKFPLKWECNGGGLLSGEDNIEGLIREIYEELGIILKKENAIFLKSVRHIHGFKEIYVFKKDILIQNLSFKDGEVINAKWVTIDEFMTMFNNREIVDNIDFDEKDYEKCLFLLGLSN